jgi:hypothetical protein
VFTCIGADHSLEYRSPYATSSMTRKYKSKLGSRTYAAYSVEKLQEALTAIRNKTLTQRQAAVRYNIPRSTLKYKLKGKHFGHPGGPTIFSASEEETFKAYVMTTSSYGFPVDTFDLRCIVKAYADKKGLKIRQFNNNMPGKDWADSFLRRHRDLTVRFASNIKRKRAEVGAAVVDEYFENLTKELDGVAPSNIWNYDETNLSDEPGQKRVITKRGCKYPERIINSTKSCTSLMFCGNAEGETLPPYVVYKAESLWSTWMEHGPPQARYNRSRSGWFDTQCFEDWFFSLLLPRLRKGDGSKHVLIGDNLSSHLNVAVLEACKQNNISFVALPPNSTHLTQPLDVAFFRPMKIAWKKLLTDWKEKGKGRRLPSIPKDEFPKLLNALMEKLKTNGADNLKSGFRKTGIYPLDKSQVISRLPADTGTASGTSAAIGQPTTSDLVSSSFLEHLRKARGDNDDACLARARRRKVAVAPGKSLSVDDIPAVPVRASCSKKASARKVTSTAVSTAAGSSTVQQRVPSTGTSSESETDDVAQTRSSNSANSSFSCSDVEPDASTPHSSSGSSSPNKNSVEAGNKSGAFPLNKGDHVLVKYEGRLYPGAVMLVKKMGANVRCMKASGRNWKWPAKPDELYYPQCDIIKIIPAPNSLRRGLYSVSQIPE